MFDFGFWEVVLVLIVALLVVGPEKLPQLARTTGMWVGRLKRMASNMKEELEDEFEATRLKQMLDDQQAEIKELKGMLKDTQKGIEKDFEETQSEIKETGNLMKAVEKQLNEDLVSSVENREPEEKAPSDKEQDEPAEKSR